MKTAIITGVSEGLGYHLAKNLLKKDYRVVGFNPGGFKSKLFAKATGVLIDDWSKYMDPQNLASLLISIIELPKNMEVSEIVVNRK